MPGEKTNGGKWIITKNGRQVMNLSLYIYGVAIYLGCVVWSRLMLAQYLNLRDINTYPIVHTSSQYAE